MQEKMTVVVYATTGGTFGRNALEIEIDKEKYESADDKDAFLQEILDEFIGEVVETGVYIKED